MPAVGCFANVIVDIAANSVRDRLFTYTIPETLMQDVSLGVPVLVPFGKSRTIAGYVISLSNDLPEAFAAQNIELKEIVTVLDEQVFFDAQYIEFLKWVADYYLSSLMDVITAALPACLVPRLKQTIHLVDELAEKEKEKDEKDWTKEQNAIIQILKQNKKHELSLTTLKQRWCKVLKQKDNNFYKVFNNLLARKIIERRSAITAGIKTKTKDIISWTNKEANSEPAKRVIAVLQENLGQLSKAQLAKKAQVSSATIAKLLAQGILSLSKEDQIRDPLQYLQTTESNTQKDNSLPELTGDQLKVFSVLKEALHATYKAKTPAPDNTPWLLHGVTGSGKTEIYLRLINEALNLNHTALLMVPEIALTPQLAERLVQRFGKQVAVWHSGLSDGERFDTWRRLQIGELKILLGARSAILVNMPKLGLIIIDEEHDASYKQTTPSPRYNAKTLALQKAKLNGALVLCGSATPDIVTYYVAQKESKILAMPKRIFNQGFPKTIIVDMRSEFTSGNRSIFSKSLADALHNCLEKKEQAILLLNRRGYASHVFCRACGYIASCKNCSVPMVYHRLSTTGSGSKEIDLLICHHCGYQFQLSHTCPSCKQPFLKNYGLGTQRVELELQELLPEAKIIRLDSDIAQKKGAHEAVFHKFASQKADILIGTQMIAKGLDNANVTLVGILAADAAFNLSDYRCTERGFQLLTQVAGRAGRGHLPGQVIVQTYNPQLPALKSSLSHDYQSFYDAELPTRQSYFYPPFSQLIRIVIAGEDLDKTVHVSEKTTEALSNYLADLTDASQMMVLGPAPCLLERLHGKYRQHLIVKNTTGDHGRHLIASFFKNKQRIDDVQIAVDMDAIDLL